MDKCPDHGSQKWPAFLRTAYKCSTFRQKYLYTPIYILFSSLKRFRLCVAFMALGFGISANNHRSRSGRKRPSITWGYPDYEFLDTAGGRLIISNRIFSTCFYFGTSPVSTFFHSDPKYFDKRSHPSKSLIPFSFNSLQDNCFLLSHVPLSLDGNSIPIY